FGLLFLAVAATDDVTADGGEDSGHPVAGRDDECRLVDRREPAWRPAELVAVVRPEVQEPLVGDALHHQADLGRVTDEDQPRTRPPDASEEIADAGALDLREGNPARRKPILDRVFMTSRTD